MSFMSTKATTCFSGGEINTESLGGVRWVYMRFLASHLRIRELGDTNGLLAKGG